MALKTTKPRVEVLDTRRVKPAAKVADAELLTSEYRAWRDEVIRRARGRCQAPGCGRSGVRLFADHIVERKDGGALLDPKNGQALCGKHHSLKTAQARAARQRA